MEQVRNNDGAGAKEASPGEEVKDANGAAPISYLAEESAKLSAEIERIKASNK